MVKLAAHGREIGTVFFTASAKRYMSDGAILKNIGFGWKIAGKVKPGVSPQDAFDRQRAYQRDQLAGQPANAAYRKTLHAIAGMSKRWKLHAAVELMPDDCDGVWSECCDGYGDNISADVDEVAELCRLYRAALAESRERTAA